MKLPDIQRNQSFSELVYGLLHPFYGWVIVLSAMALTFASGPGQSFMFSVFINPIIEDTGYTRTTLSSIYAVGTVASALTVMIVSRLSDSYGPRLMLIVIGLILGAACIAMSMETGLVVIGVTLAFLRALGQGALGVNGSILVSQWFVLHRGRAMALVGLGTAITIAVMPNLGQTLINLLTWRGAYLVLGLLVWAIVLPLAIFVVRDRPEDMGLYPDGVDELPEDEIRRVRQARRRVHRKVLTSLDFWALAFPLSIPPLVDTALIFHQVELFQRQGLSADIAARAFIPFAIASAITGILAGFVVERTGPTPLFVFNVGVFVIAILILQFVHTPLFGAFYAAVLGAGMGMQQIGSRYTWPYYYGRQGLGQVQGSAMMIMISATALGPLLFSSVAEGIGYQTVFVGMLSLLILAAVMRILYHIQPA